MLRLTAFLLAILVGASTLAQEPKPTLARLTKQQLAEGWICLFDGETTFGLQATIDSKWNVFKGMLAPEGDKPATLLTTMPFDNYQLEIDYQTRSDRCELLVGYTMADGLAIGTHKQRLIPTSLTGVATVSVTVRSGNPSGATFRINDGLTTFANVAFPARIEEKAAPKPGLLGVRGPNIIIRGMRMRPVEAKPLFNGKSLDGWKVFEGKKGKFTTTPTGEISVKDGPGDLATEQEFSDFVLQLECQSNGKHLNSGIFFRALPGQYQMGYEAQIQNGWLDKVKTIEVDAFDPKTGAPTGKQKIETLAADFGTGAIYRRIPARRQMAEDHEWFHMTVVANGRRIATWVNGIQTVDWVDPRELKENPRQGCRLEKGVLSIQAHDPTTDLLFRNLRIVDLAAKKE